MSTSSFSAFFAVLSLVCAGATLAVLVLVVLARARPGSAAHGWLDAIRELALGGAALVACVTTAGSLYYSEVAHYTPCELCWYQRICMYPLSVVLVVAAARRDRDVWRYVLGPAAVGVVIATYHAQLQAYPTQHSFCSTTNPCTVRYVWELGFISLPLMALAAFSFVLVMVLVARTAPTVDSPGGPAA